MGFLSSIFSANERILNKLNKTANLVESLSDKYKAMTDDELKSCTVEFKKQYEGGKTLDDLLPDAFAAFREASDRVLHMRHFHVQIIGGIVLHQGRVAEMRTGEGKTLVATLPAYLNALTGKGVHIVTVNDYLARRDCEWMGKAFRFMGLTVGVVFPGLPQNMKKEAYRCDITYCTNNELGFDYLRDNMAVRLDDRVQVGLNFAILDEVDSILVDEARTPLIISGKGEKSTDLYQKANSFVRRLSGKIINSNEDDNKSKLDRIAESFDKNAKSDDEEYDYILDEKEKTVRITDRGSKRAEQTFGLENYTDIENAELAHHIQQALKANYTMKRDVNYIVKDGEVLIVDQFTGRIMVGRRYSDGLHQAIEAKEGVQIRNENKTMATITFQNLFRLYKKLSGMTGTAKTEEQEFRSIYGLDVVVIPTNLPMVRVDENDAIFKSVKGKTNAILNEICACFERKQPVLVGTLTVEKSEDLSGLLKKRGVKHNVLNAKNHAQEAEIVAQAGRVGAVTIATNMAGRGTDILLGGNPEYLAKQRLRTEGVEASLIELATSYKAELSPEVAEVKARYDALYAQYKADTDREKAEVIALGGLRIIGTERHESRRIDNQLRGRAGRQGDPGSSIFMISLEDDLARFFGGEILQRAFNFLKVDDDDIISNGVISKQIEFAQKRVEGSHFSTRKNVLEYDDVMNTQRKIMYTERDKVLESESVYDNIVKLFPAYVSSVLDEFGMRDLPPKKWDLEQINEAIKTRLLPGVGEYLTEDRLDYTDVDQIESEINGKLIEQYNSKIERYKESGINFHEVERIVFLKTVDRLWTDHIDAMDKLRRGIGLRGYANQNPVDSYKKEGFEMFDEMITAIQTETVESVLRIEVRVVPQMKSTLPENSPEAMGKPPVPGKSGKSAKIGPNDPCPCGSGKKYKRCCGSGK